jgi:hypothetical protein
LTSQNERQSILRTPSEADHAHFIWLVGWLVGCLTTSAVTATGCAGHDEGSSSPQETLGHKKQRVRDGNNDDNNDFPFVGRWVNPTFNTLCSGTLITPTWVLTAGHCVTGSTSQNFSSAVIQNSINGNYTVFFGTQPQTGFSARHSFTLNGNTPNIGAITQLIYPNGRNNPLSTRKTTAYSVNIFTGSDSYRDVALIQLDQRVQISQIRPLHPATEDFTFCGDNFGAFVVGYGGKSIVTSTFDFSVFPGIPPNNPQPRNFQFSEDWTGTSKGNGESIFTNTWFTTPFYTTYEGGLPGDSGGPLVRPDTNLSPPFRLCGVGSAYGIVPSINPLSPTPVYWDVANVNSANNRAFLQDRGVIDQAGRFMGECLPSELTGTDADDTDSDFDLIPDACDPCRFVPDPEYRFTGQFSLPDQDGDGVADACDNCPLNASSNQNDSDADGVGDVCDTAVSPGSDIACCTSNADCPGLGNSCISFGTWIPGNTPAGGAAYCFNRNEARCARPLDSDGDKIPDHVDNCPLDKNENQFDSDGDGIGDICDQCTRFSFDERVRDSSLFIDTNLITKEVINCNPTQNGDLSGKQADQFCFLSNTNVRSKCVRTALGPTGGICTEGPDSDEDGVGNACDNCPDVANKPQDNCNLEMEATLNQGAIQSGDLSSLRGDVCDPTPCAPFLRSLFSSPQTPQGGMLAEVSPILLPPSAPDAYSLANPNTPPDANVGLRFCTCGNRDGVGRDPLECSDSLEAACVVNGTLLNAGLNNPWLAPSFRPVGNTNEPWNDGAIPLGNPTSIVNNVPFSNASPKNYPSTLLSTEAPPGLAQWDTSRWQNAPMDMVGPISTPGNAVCAKRFGVQGVVWTSIRSTNNLIPSAASTSPLEVASSHYAYGQWGTDANCGPNPFEFYIPPTKQLCPTCPKSFLGLSELLIYSNPNPGENWTILATDGYKILPISDIPAQVGDPWIQPGVQWVTASDATSRQTSNAVVLVAWQSVTRKVTSAFSYNRGTFVPAVRGPRALAETGEPTELLQAASPTTEQGPEPSPRENPGLALSSRENTLYLVSGVAGTNLTRDLWRYDLTSQQWSEVELGEVRPERPLAVTYHEPSRELYITDEVKKFGLRFGRLLRINPNTGKTTLLGWWPRLRTFDRHFLSVGPEGELVLSASSSKGKGHHVTVVFEEKNGQLTARWGLVGAGSLDGAPTLTNEGLTRPFESTSMLSKRFTPTQQLPKKGGPILGGCF